MIHTMIDIETLDVLPSAVILSIGAVKFNPMSTNNTYDDTFECLVDITEQTEVFNRTISDDTVEWWSAQDPSTRELAFAEDGRLNMTDTLNQLHRFVWNSDCVWTYGKFDAEILENAFRSINKPFPWKYNQLSDARSILKVVRPKIIDNPALHYSLADAIVQAQEIVAALQFLKWTGSPLS